MSLEATKAVWERSKADGHCRLLMLAIADYADRDGRAYPSQSQLSEKARISRRTVQRLLDQLESSGELVIERPGGGRERTHYRIALIRGASNAPHEAVVSDASGASPDADSRSSVTPQGRQIEVAIRKNYQGTINNYQEQEAGTPPKIHTPDHPLISHFEDELDFATAQVMERLTIFGSKNRSELRGFVSRSAKRLELPPIRAGDYMCSQYERYRSLGGRKEPYWFMADGFHLKPEPEWNLNGVNTSSSNQPRTAQARRLAALYAASEEPADVAD